MAAVVKPGATGCWMIRLPGRLLNREAIRLHRIELIP
jgi:hypothetical protein